MQIETLWEIQSRFEEDNNRAFFMLGDLTKVEDYYIEKEPKTSGKPYSHKYGQLTDRTRY